MIFSTRTADAAGAKFAALLERAGEEKKREILNGLAGVKGRAADSVVPAVKWLYANSPLSDWANYDFPLFLSCAEHGVFLRENSPYAKELPEDIFLNYVLHIRVNEEELRDCRKEFYRLVKDRVRGLPDEEAVIEANYWCAEHVTYRSTDDRTISAMGAYRSGFGRCGEESVFAVNVFRALGIPARQIYTPRWAHCDDNHAWVEVWCGGGWHFLGACEPEEVLDRGWFTSAASRAMVIHSRCFGEISGEEVIAQAGAVTFLNHLPRYAETKRLTAAVRDEAGAAVEGAQVTFGILNYSGIFPAAVTVTGEDGLTGLTCGLGSVHLRAAKGDAWCERTVSAADTDRVELVLSEKPPVFDTWEEFISYAPRDRGPRGKALTDGQRARGRQKSAAAGEKRQRRAEGMFDPVRAGEAVRRYGCSQAVYALLEKSCGNMEGLLDFLADERFDAGEKERLLLTLTEKDWRDVDPDVLREALAAEQGAGGGPDVICPRVLHEPLWKSRRFILEYFTQEQKAAFRACPVKIWEYIQANIGFAPDVEYAQLVTGPAGALSVKNASPLSKKILFVTVCRALGIAARLNPVDGQAEYDAGDGFRPVEPPPGGAGTLVLEKAPGEKWQYETDFSVSLLAEDGYRTLRLTGKDWEADRLEIPARAGIYRIVTANRLPNGDLYAGRYHLCVENGEKKNVRLQKYEAPVEAMLGSFALEDFTVYDEAGHPVLGSELTKGKAVLMWLEEGREPTEHILNELLEREAEFRSLPADIIFMVRDRTALENAKLQKVLAAFGQIRVYYDSFGPNVETLARRLYVDHEKLPLIIAAAGPLNAVYASSGYNVGSGDMIVKICRLS
ncbi:MAG: transglutaminase domain-containing protein [Oscillospiraceae bacterium]|nr:transglutaminase domain-containing protein [Oscillospiraceae bacterium]